MKFVFYQCDWCGTKSSPVNVYRDHDVQYHVQPEGWADLPGTEHADTLCKACLSTAHQHAEAARHTAKAVCTTRGAEAAVKGETT